MATSLTAEQIQALAPDAASAKAGNKLATSRDWVTLGQGDGFVWGECKGSAKDPYRVQADLSDLTVRCSCPSRKLPCKHGLGLLLLFVSKPDAVTAAELPAWVAEWKESRAESARRKAERQNRAAAEEDDPAAKKRREQAQAKTAAARQAKVVAGLEELGRWLRDQMRQGLAGLQQQGHTPFDTMAARMIDAQAPGVARRLRDMAGIASSGPGWQGRLLERMALLHLLIEAYGRLETLSPETQADVRTAVGFTYSQDELLTTPSVRDRWLVLGQQIEEEERLKVQRTWLWGREANRPALVLDFSVANQPLDRSLVPGICLDAELVFFPGASQLRALVRQRHSQPEPIAGLPSQLIGDAIAGYAASLAHDPWLEQLPLTLGPIQLTHENDGSWLVRDESDLRLPLSSRFLDTWRLLATSGGHPFTLAGTWDGHTLAPLCAWAGDQLLLLATAS